MIKVAHIADSHFDAAPNGRLEECVRLHEWIADDMERRGVDLILHAGDVYERESVPEDRNAAVAVFQRYGEIAPVMVVKGNHDAHRDLEVLRRIRCRHGIKVEERAELHAVRLVNRDLTVHVGCLAWPEKAQILASLPACAPEVANAVAGDAIRDIMIGFSEAFERASRHDDGPRILLTHAMVRASRVGQRGQPLIKADMEIGVEDLALSLADYIALGHIHKGQDWTVPPRDNHPHAVPVVYPGGPRRTAYGEMEAKGYALVEFHHHDGELTHPDARRWGPCDWQFIEAPAQRMILIEDEWGNDRELRAARGEPPLPDGEDDDRDGWLVGHIEGVGDGPVEPQYRGADIRLRYKVPADKREPAKLAADKWVRDLIEVHGAERVKLEERVITTTRPRAPEVARAETLEDKAVAMWNHRGDVPEERRPRLLSKLRQLEQRARS